MKNRILRTTMLGMLVSVLGLGLVVSPANAAPTKVEITVTADAYATDGSGQITSSSEFLYDSSKGEGPQDSYQIAYRGTLDMTEVWRTFSTFRTTWLALNKNDVARWKAKTFSGKWEISFTTDPSVVSTNPEFVTCDALQTEIVDQNQETTLSQIIRCTEVTLDPETGKYLAVFDLKHSDGSKVTGADLDDPANRPKELRLTTPAQALYVQQSKFVAGKTFEMTEPRVTGELSMDAFYIGMPLTFDASAEPVKLTMVQTYDASFGFESSTPGRSLPADVLALQPSVETRIRDGDVVTPPAPSSTSVSEGQGVWEFTGWNPENATMAGANLHFVGAWKYVAGQNETFNVAYRFVQAEGGDLPGEVLDLLPSTGVATQGETVSPADPAQTEVEVVDVSGETRTVTTWSFEGWDPNSILVDATDVEFVGTWSRSVKVVEPEKKPGPESDIARTGAPEAGFLALGGITLAILGGMLLLRRVRS